MVGIFDPQKIGLILRYSSMIRDDIDKWGSWVDSSHWKGQTIILHDVLIVGLSDSASGQTHMAGILDSENVGTPFLYDSIIKRLMNKRRL